VCYEFSLSTAPVLRLKRFSPLEASKAPVLVRSVSPLLKRLKRFSLFEASKAPKLRPKRFSPFEASKAIGLLLST